MGIGTIFRRANWIAELRLVVAVAQLGAVLVAVASVARAFVGRVVEVTVPAEYAVPPGVPGPELRPGARLAEGSWVDVTVTDASSGQIVLALLHDGAPLALAMVMLVLLYRVLARVEPFTVAGSRRLFALGGALLAGGVLVPVVQVVTSAALVDTVSRLPAFRMSTNLVWWLAGFGFLAIGEVVRRGAAMRAELDEVI